MKKKLLVFNLILFILFSQNCFPQNKTTITGRVKNVSSKEIRLNNFTAKIDSSGLFKFELDIVQPDVFKLNYIGNEIDLFLEPKEVLEITFDASKFYQTLSYSGKSAFIQQFLSTAAFYGSQNDDYLNANWSEFVSLPEKEYIEKVESLRAKIVNPLEQFISEHQGRLNNWFIKYYRLSNKFGYDWLIYSYPLWHYSYISIDDLIGYHKRSISAETFNVNDPDLLKIDGYTRLMKDILQMKVRERLHADASIRKKDNQCITAAQTAIIKTFQNETLRNYWLHSFLLEQIDHLGIKNIEGILTEFNNICTNDAYKKEINDLYKEELKSRQDHLIKTYKEIDGFKLDAHIFIPKDIKPGEKRPAIVHFTGGGFSYGKPDWYFGDDNNGFISVAVEYRFFDSQGVMPFEEMSDAKSAIRWLRQHADELQIDPNKIIASGNSAGGALVLSAAMLEGLDEPNEDLSVSSKPNVIILNAAAYELTDSFGPVKDKKRLTDVSALNLIKPNLPPSLVIHGTNDKNVPFKDAQVFVDKMKAAGNLCEFEVLNGARHVPWLYPPYSLQAAKAKNKFLKQIGYIK